MSTALRGRADAPPAPRRAAAGDLVAAAAILVLGIAAFLAFPDDLALLTRMLTAALFVLSLDLVVGYCGIATLGHAALFGAGAYAAGIACVRGLADPVAMIAVGAVAGALAGLVSGVIIARVGGLPQIVLSIAVLRVFAEAANKARDLTGGSDGLSGVAPAPLFGVFDFDLFGRTAFMLALLLLVIVLLVLRRLVRSPFGLLCRGIKGDPVRLRAMGAAAYPNLVRMYAISGAVAGIAGALAAVTTGVVGLDSLGFDWSASALVMLVLGGTGTLYGAVLGALAFTGIQHVVSLVNPFHWLILLGALLVAVVLFLPGGLQSLAARVVRR
jgi:branched-chain amino acid transport system permease protein